MKSKYISILILLLAVVAMDIAVIAREYATEAPAGFDTPTLAQNPGSQSISDGIAQPPGDTYALDQTKFEQDHDASTGFGAGIQCQGVRGLSPKPRKRRVQTVHGDPRRTPG